MSKLDVIALNYIAHAVENAIEKGTKDLREKVEQLETKVEYLEKLARLNM